MAGALRLTALGRHSLWFDEALSARLAQSGWHELTATLVAADVHPPLYFYLLKVWVALAGTSEAVLRFPSVVASLVSVLLAYGIMRRVAPGWVSLLAALLIGLSPFDVMVSQEARMYALLEMLTLASTLAVLLAVERHAVVPWLLYTASVAALLYTHYLGILVLLAHGLWLVGFERPHATKWVLAAGGAVFLYVPWMPSFWHQFAVGELQQAWFRHSVRSTDLTGLLGLFAFGGSLLGMPSFFTAGPLDPVLQWILLLPFLFLVWRGAVSLSSSPRDLALLGLASVLPIGSMLLISLIKPMFYARWFSFLLPFYAMFVALGIAETAGRRGGRGLGLPAALAAAVLCCSIPVFGQYYFDPHARPYQWREAAALVRGQAQPQDFILYIHDASQIAFGYYFHDPHPSLVLNPVEAFAGTLARPAFTAPQARELASRYHRVWVIIMPPFDETMAHRLFPALRTAFRFGDVRYFGGVGVVRLDAKR